jgi:hypothetical protein
VHALRVIAPLATLMIAATSAHAQTQWIDRDARSSVRIERLEATSEYFLERGATYAAFLTARVPVGATTWLVTEIPYAHSKVEAADYDYTSDYDQRTFGNVYVGAERARSINGFRYEAGVRLPLASYDAGVARYTGHSAGVEHEQAFAPRATALRAGIFLHRRADRRLPLGFDIGIAPVWQARSASPPRSYYPDERIEPFNIYSDWNADELHRAVFIDGVANVRLEGAHARLGAGLTVRALIDGPGRNASENSADELTFALELLRGPLHPGVTLGLPLDVDQKSFTSRVVGLSLSTENGRAQRWKAAP